MGHVGSTEKAKLSRIQPLHVSLAQFQTVVISSGISSIGFFRELYINIPLSS
ncbi:hypothetical protein PPM_0321 [Paenibacillus polymyxa M1]|nr:hypothetical protein PPM_0321 [Paenibacillus polymyxa M1]